MRIYQFLTRLGAIVLLATAALKMCESTKRNFYFQEPDSVVQFVNNRQLMLIAGSFEIIVAVYVWFTASLTRRSLALIWFCSIVALYKAGRYLTRAVYPCSCLGILEKWLNLTWRETDSIGWFVLALLVILSIACLCYEMRARPRPSWKATEVISSSAVAPRQYCCGGSGEKKRRKC
jgi:hypothetical protein